MGAMWEIRGNDEFPYGIPQQNATWVLHIFHNSSTCFPHGSHMFFILVPHVSYTDCIVFAWFSCEFFQYGYLKIR